MTSVRLHRGGTLVSLRSATQPTSSDTSDELAADAKETEQGLTDDEVAARVDELRGDLRFEDALAVVDRHPVATMEARAANRILHAAALIHREYGEWARSAECFKQAASLDLDDHWAIAEGYVANYWLASSGKAGRTWGARTKVREQIGLELASVPEETAGALHWADAVVHMGPHPDDTPSTSDIEHAETALGKAETTQASDKRVQLTRLRVEWVIAREAKDRDTAVERALGIVATYREAALRERANDADLITGIEYVDGRLRLLKRDLIDARSLFEHITTKLAPGHQAAHVWSVYCDRIIDGGSNALLEKIDGLLRAELRLGEDRSHPPGREAVILAPHLEAELLSERAALLEEPHRAMALRDYERALELRPRMTFSQRARLRCHAADGELREAADEGEELIKEARREHEERGTPMPADTLAEVGRWRQELGEPGEASRLFRESVEAAPYYAFAHAALVAACKAAGNYQGAIEAGRRALEGPYGVAAGWNGVRVELGQALLAVREYGEAVHHFKLAAADDTHIVADRGCAGLIDAYRVQGRFREGLALTPCEGDLAGPASLDAAGWLHSELGDYGEALRCFDRALEIRPHALSAMRGRVRTLRLLGCFRDAWNCLEQHYSALPEHLARSLDNDLGWLALDRDLLDEAETHFESARQLPGAESAHRGRIALASLRGASSAEISALATGAFEALGSERGPVAAEVGVAHLRLGELDTAREWLSRADSGTNGLGVVSSLYAAHELISAGAHLDAQVLLDEIASHHVSARDDPRVDLAVARLHLEMGSLDSALQLYRGVLQRWPRNGVALLGVAMACFRSDDLQRAEETLDIALDQCAQNLLAAEMKAWTLTRRHDEEHPSTTSDSERLRHAVQICERIRAIEPSRPGVFAVLAEIAALRGSMRVAELYLTQADRHTAHWVDTQRSRAIVYLRMARYDDAVACLTGAIERVDNDATLQLLLGIAHLENGNTSAAIASLRYAIELDRSTVHARIPLATALHSEHRTDEALDVLREGLTIATGRRRLPLLLTRARLLNAHASDAERRVAVLLLDEALQDVDRAQVIASEASLDDRTQADISYHRAVVLNESGRKVAAVKALRRCRKLDENREDARKAIALLREPKGADPAEVRTARWALLLGGLSVGLLILAVITAWASAGWHASKFQWDPLIWVIGALLVAIIVAATLPRLVGFDVAGQLKFSLQPSLQNSDEANVHLTFARITALSAIARLPVTSSLMAGPSTYRRTELPADREGDPTI